MESLVEQIMNIQDGERLILDRREYHVYQEDCLNLRLVVSNTCFEYESPEGEKNTFFYISNKKGVEIDGNGAKIIIHGVITPFLFTKSKKVTIKNLTVEYCRPTMSEFEIIESQRGKVKIRINEDFLYRIDGNKLVWVGEKNKEGFQYWEIEYKGNEILSQIYKCKEKKLEMLPRYSGDKHPSFPAIKKITEETKGILELEFEDENVQLSNDCIIQTRSVVRKEIGGAFDCCDHLIFENLTIHNMNGMGLVFQNCKNIKFRNCKFVPNEKNVIVSNADFLHFSGCKGKITVKNCVAIGAHDDVINVHGTHLAVVDKSDKEKTLTLRFKNPASWGFNAFEKGEKFEIINSKTLIPYAKAKIKRVENVDKYTVKLTLFKGIDKDIKLGEDVVENISRTAKLQVENCRFERISSRAILCTTRKNVVIKNTIFKDMCGPVLYVADDCNFWYESGRSGTVRFVNNSIEACDNGFTGNGENVIQYEPIVIDKTSVIPVHKKLIVEGNYFKKSTNNKHVIKLEYLEQAKIVNNLFDSPYEIIKDKTVALVEKNNTISK